MLGRLTVYPDHAPSEVFYVEPTKSVTLGRGDDVDLRIEDDRLSRRHARIVGSESEWCIEDLGSKNGTFVQGRRIVQENLKKEAWLELGGLLGRFEIVRPEVRDRAIEEAKRRRDDSRIEGRGLSEESQLDTLQWRILDSVLHTAGAERGFLLIQQDDRLEVVTSVALSADQLVSKAFSGSIGAIRVALNQKRSVITCDAAGLTALRRNASVVDGRIRALVCLPLELDGATRGVVYADSRQIGKTFTRLDVEILEELAEQAALALAAARVQSELVSLVSALGSDPDHARVSATMSRLLAQDARDAAP